MQPQPPPMLSQGELVAMRDAEHLKLLSILHYVMAGLAVLGGCLASVYLLMGFFFARIPVSTAPGGGGRGVSPADAEMLEMMAWLWGVLGGVGLLFFLALAVCCFLAARFLALRRHPVFVQVVAGLECLAFPLGTGLGVFTIIVLQRPAVRALFAPGYGAGSPPAPAAGADPSSSKT